MHRHCRAASVIICALGACFALGAEWSEFRGPRGQGISAEKGLPVEWSSKKNIVWQTKLPGPGGSSPVTIGKRIFLTCYTGYALDPTNPGTMEDLRRHVICVDRTKGNILWTKEIPPVLPEHKYAGEGSYHGYSSSTPVTDGERLYVFFGKSGVFCFDLDGNQLWHTLVGKGINGWGSGASPVLYKQFLIVNASVESSALVALDKMTGKEEWRAKGISSAWNTPVLVTAEGKEPELVISVQDRVLGLNPDTGMDLWKAEGVHRYVCPSVVSDQGVVYAIGGGHTSLAVKTGGRGDVTQTHVVWRQTKGSNVCSPIYHDGHLYWASDHGGLVNCQEAATGKMVYQQRLAPASGIIYASPVLADGKLYYVSQTKGTFVVAAKPDFTLLAHNVFEDDSSRTNASPAVSSGQLLLRSDQYLYCIGNRE
jgi:outer membrane protein assembly factor BamB